MSQFYVHLEETATVLLQMEHLQKCVIIMKNCFGLFTKSKRKSMTACFRGLKSLILSGNFKT